jgi:glycosyltransferase involved in cell wall biosynthesis
MWFYSNPHNVSTTPTSGAEGVDVTIGIPTRNRAHLLGKSIASVLGQSYRHFTLVVSDNASDDDTATLVASFRDPRLVYRPLKRNIGRAANINRLIELAETEFVVLLGDDDELHSDHLYLTVEALKRWPTVGVAHTGCEIVDLLGNTLVPHARLMNSKDPIVFESGAQFLQRAMKSGWTVCFPSATFRRAALVGGGGLRPEDGVIDDLPLLMRIATDWDFAYLNRPLAVIGAHTGASSSSLGSFTPHGFFSSRSLPDMLYEHRRRFLTEADLPEIEGRRLARMAEKTYRRDRVHHLSMRARAGEGQLVMFRALAGEVRRDRRLLLDPIAWRFVAGQLGGRRLRDGVRRALDSARDSR